MNADKRFAKFKLEYNRNGGPDGGMSVSTSGAIRPDDLERLIAVLKAKVMR